MNKMRIITLTLLSLLMSGVVCEPVWADRKEDLELLDAYVGILSEGCPIEVDDDMTITNITLDNAMYLDFHITIKEKDITIKEIQDNKEIFKKEIANNLSVLFSEPVIKDLIKNLHIGLKFSFKSISSGQSCMITMPYKDFAPYLK